MDSVRVITRSRLSASPEQARDARARAWVFVLFECWHTKKGDHYALTSDSTKNMTTSTDKKGNNNAHLHSN